MTRSLGIALAAAGLALAGAAHAQAPAQLDARTLDSWRKVDLGGGVSVGVPTAVGEAYRPTDKQDAGLMLFRVAVKDAGEMYCGLDRLLYNTPPLGMARRRAIDFFSNANMAIFCHGVGAGVRESLAEPVTSAQGYPGSRCVASYTDKAGDRSEGDVIQARAVVGSDALYVLTCTVRDLDQTRAETDWETIWRPRIGRIEDSLKLP
jgi:hypothetical protein